MAAVVLRCCCCCFVVLWWGCACAEDHIVARRPALYVLGDSLAEVGNNDYLALSIAKANYPHNGVDYPGGTATGRFSNGKISADYLAEMLGVPSPPPYLSIADNSMKTQVFLQGVNFASAGAGVLVTTNLGQCLTLSKQIDYFSTVHTDLVQQLGCARAKEHLAKSIFALIIGSNDILNYIWLIAVMDLFHVSPQLFVDAMITKLREQLETLYSLGARKFAFVGTGPVGCCPSQRDDSTGSCNAKANSMSLMYSAGVVPLLQEMKSEHSDMSYSFLNSSSAFHTIFQDPAKFGFAEVKAACCGLGSLNAKSFCLPFSSLCANRSDHVFWDLFHPSQRTTKLIITTFFRGSSPDVYPINVDELSSL